MFLTHGAIQIQALTITCSSQKKTEPLVNNTIDYEALSYTWGDQTNPVRAHIVDTSMSTNSVTEIKLGRNLASALQHLRYAEEPRTLWIDTICSIKATLTSATLR